MSIFSKTGSFITTADATVGTKYYIRAVGFRPKVVMLWNSGAQSLGDTYTSAGYSIGFGVAIDSTHRFCSSSMAVKSWGQASARRISDVELLCIWNPTGNPNNRSIAGKLDLSQMRNDGFDIVVSQQFYSETYKVSYLALGGDDLTNAYIGKATMPTETGNYDVTGIGFQPDFIMTSGSEYSTIPVSGDGFLQLGWASSASNQGVVSFACSNGGAAEVTNRYGYNGEILGSAVAGYQQFVASRREAFVEFLSDGFRLNNLEGANAFQYMYLALKGGKYFVGDITTRTDTNDITETVGFRPRVLMFNSVCNSMNTQDVSSASAAMSIGIATTPTNGAVHSIWDGVEGRDGISYATYDNKVYANVRTGAIIGTMDLKSIEPNGFTCVMSDADDTENWVSYLAIGNTADNIDYVHAFMPPRLPEYSVSSSKHAYMNTIGQHFSAKAGSFNLGTETSGTVIVTGLEFQPQLMLFWWDGGISTDGNVVGGNTNYGFAAATSSANHIGCEYMSEDAQGTSDTMHWQYNQDYGFRMYTDTANWNTFWGFTSFQYNGFTINYGGYAGAATPYRINYLALQGIDITNIKVGYKQFFNSTGNHAFTGIGFQPDALLFVSSINYSYNGSTSHGQFMIGMATGVNNQGLTSIYSQDNVGITNTKSYCSNTEVTALSGTNVNNRNTLVSFDTDGFTLNTLEAGSTYYFFYVALKGGRYKVGNFNTKTDGSDISVTNVGFPPKAILLTSNNRPMSTQDTPSDHASMSIGAASSIIDRTTIAIWDENGLDTSEVTHAKYDTAVYANIKDDAIQGLMDLKSIDEDGFTCVMDDTDPTENFVTYIAFGANKPAFIRSSKSAYVYGHDPNGSEVRAYTKGVDFALSSKYVFTNGGIKVSSSVHAYIDTKLPAVAGAAGSFNIDTALTVGQTQTISGIGFQPKLVLFWTSGTEQNTYPTYWGDEDYIGERVNLNVNFGAAIDSTHRFCVVSYLKDSATTSNTYRSQNNNEIIRTYIPSGTTPRLDGILDFDSTNADGFTVIIDDQFDSAYRVSYLALGGIDVTDVYIGNTTLPTTSGYFDITDVEFQPSALIVVTQEQLSTIDEGENALLSLGWATIDGQGVTSYVNRDNLTVSSAESYGYNNEIYASMNPTASGIDCRGEFIEFLSNGFRLNHISGATAYKLYYIAIKGGTYVSGSTHSLENYNEIDLEENIGVRPTCILFSSPVNYLSTVNTPISDAFFSLGAATLMGQAAQGIFSYNGGTSLYASSINTGYYTNGDYNSGLILLGFNDDGWTFQAPDWWYDPAPYWINYLAIGVTANLNVNSSIPAYMNGLGSETTSKHAYLSGGVTGNITSVPAYMNTILGSSTFISAYMSGVASVTSVSAYIYGQVKTTTSKHAYLNSIQVPIYGPLVWTS